MHPCGLCSFSTRQGVLIIGISLTLAYIAHLVMTFVKEDFFSVRVTPVQYGSIIANQILMFVVTALIILGAIFKNRWLLVPFIVFGLVNVLGGAILLIASVLNLVRVFNGTLVGIFGLTLFTFLLMIWALWTVILYFMELGRSEGYAGLEEDGPFDAPTRRTSKAGYPSQGRHHPEGKPTVVSKMLHDLK